MLPVDNDVWDELDSHFDDAGPNKNMYVFTKAFSSTGRFIHLGPYDQDTSNLLANAYGNVDTEKQSWWSMQSASSTAVNKETKYKDWLEASSIGDERISLVARQSLGSQQYGARHTGLKVSQGPNGHMTTELLWNDTVADGNSEYTPGEVLYGNFDTVSHVLTMIKYFGRSKGESKVEAWSVPTEKGPAPRKHPIDIPLGSVK